MPTTFFSLLSKAALTAAVVLVSSLARADEPATPETTDVPKPAAGRAGRGVAFGFDNGLFGRAYEQGVRVRIPIVEHFAFALRGISTLGDTGADDPRWQLGGRAEIIGHTPVYLNLVRLYGGGGPEIATRVSGSGGDKTSVGGGGHFGFEFFLHPGMSFFAEIGGHSGDGLTGGGTAVAGMALYPFTGP